MLLGSSAVNAALAASLPEQLLRSPKNQSAAAAGCATSCVPMINITTCGSRVRGISDTLTSLYRSCSMRSRHEQRECTKFCGQTVDQGNDPVRNAKQCSAKVLPLIARS